MYCSDNKSRNIRNFSVFPNSILFIKTDEIAIQLRLAVHTPNIDFTKIKTGVTSIVSILFNFNIKTNKTSFLILLITK